MNVPLGLIAAFAASRVIRESWAPGTTGYDLPGALLSTLGLVSLVYGFTKASLDGWTSAPTLAFLSIAVVLLATFVVVEFRTKNPLLPMRVIAERSRGDSFLASFLLGAGLFAMFVFLSYYMQAVLHDSALKAGVAFLPPPSGSSSPQRPLRPSCRGSDRGCRWPQASW